MYSSFRQISERMLRIPHDPSPPPGDESSTRMFRAAPNYYRYLLFLWALKAGGALLIVFVAVVVPSGVLAFNLTKEGKAWGHVVWLIPIAVISLHVVTNLFPLAVLRLNFEKRWYVVTDQSLRVREGVMAVREMTLNFPKIQKNSISLGS